MMISRFRCSGVMSHLLSLTAELNRLGSEAVVVITDCPAPYREQLRRYQRYFPCFTENRPEEILSLARYYRPELLHLHALPSGGTLARLFHLLPLPWGLTLHDQPFPSAKIALLPAPSFVILPHPAAALPAALQQNAYFIPEGIDLQRSRLSEKKGFKVALILDEENGADEGSAALLKAAALADLEVELISPRPLPLLRGNYHGRPLDCAEVLLKTQITVGHGRALLEGMAWGNAALIFGRSYGGLFDPRGYPARLFPNLLGEGDEPPCYRSIFFDLSTLLKNRPLLESLQQQGRRFVRESCDLRLITEQTSRLYNLAARP